MSIIEKLQSYGLKIGSCGHITTYYDEKNDNKLSKDVHMPAKWNTNITIKKTHTCFYIVTGKISGVIVVDLDDLENEHEKVMKNLADNCANVIVKTRKGYHYYFKYDEDFSNVLRKEQMGVSMDIQTNGQYVYCPPSQYKHHETGEVFKYELIKSEGNGILSEMSKELKEYIIRLRDTHSREKSTSTKKTKKTTTKEITKKEDVLKPILKNTNKEPDDVMFKLLVGLNPNRSIITESWLKIAYCLHNEHYDLKFFDYISKLHYDDYDDKVVKKTYENLIIKKQSDQKLGVGTLWSWLMIDNEKVFYELRKDKVKEFLQLEIKSDETFLYTRMIELIESDKKKLKHSYYFLFSESCSFQYFNHFHVYVNPQDTIYRVEGENEPLSHDKIMLPNAFVPMYLPTGEVKEIKFMTMWKKSTKIRMIDKFEFNPSPDRKDNQQRVNLFTGFKYDITSNDGKYDIEKIKPFIKHVENICSGEEAVSNYILNWMAWLIQFPHKKTAVTIVFYSFIEGNGKNIIFDILHKIFGKYYLKLKNTTEFAKNFNSHQQNKILAVCDEINARARDLADELKDVITRDELSIEYKGKEVYSINDYMNIILTTNNENVIRVPTSDRRFMIVGCREKKLSDVIIKKLLEIKENDDLLRQLYNFLKTRDLSNYDPRKIVITAYKRTLIINDMPAYIKMFQHIPVAFNGKEISPKQIYVNSLTFARDNKMAQNYTDQRVYKDIKKYFGDYLKKGTKGTMIYKFPEDFDEHVDEIIEKTTCGVIENNQKNVDY